jgi:hypothetical protein
MENYNLGAMLGAKSIVQCLNSWARLVTSVWRLCLRSPAGSQGRPALSSPMQQGLWRVHRDAVETAKRRRETKESAREIGGKEHTVVI